MIVPPNELVITITFNIEIENVSGVITICIPFSNLVPIKEKLMGDFAIEPVNKDPFWAKEIKELINSVPVDLKVRLGKTQLTANELINLSVGDVITLNKFIEDDLELLVEGVKKFSGLPGTYHGNNAIQISNLENRR
jgi:flagellar motor switch protein FliM